MSDPKHTSEEITPEPTKTDLNEPKKDQDEIDDAELDTVSGGMRYSDL